MPYVYMHFIIFSFILCVCADFAIKFHCLQASINGLTGRIEFDEGKRNNFQIDLLKLKREQLVKVGHWTSNDGINITDPNAFYETTMTNITLIVMTREVSLRPSFVMHAL